MISPRSPGHCWAASASRVSASSACRFLVATTTEMNPATIPYGFDTIVLSLVAVPGEVVRYVFGLSTIWSSATPSSRIWTRSVCVPLAGNVNVVGCDNQYAPFCHPQLLRLLAVLSVARFTRRPDVD